ncbi:phosphatase PAP2 family protein [Williamsia sp. SKLECPSW1]
MTGLQAPDHEAALTPAPPSPRLTVLRWAAVTTWAVTVAVLAVTRVLTFDLGPVIAIVVTGLVAASIGRRNPLLVLRDWLPFALVLFAYEHTRSVAAFLGMPTQWLLAVDVDRFLFGVVPTVWLQEHLKHLQPQWWEVITSAVYMSYFFVPYALAGYLWLRDRDRWRAFVIRFVVLFTLGLVGYILVPAAPPWAAAQCTTAEVADGPAFPHCITTSPAGVPDGGLLGTVDPVHDGAHPWVERISSRGWEALHIGPVRDVVEVGQKRSNQVAAIPSLHAGLTALLAMATWSAGSWRTRTAWVAYAAAMAFTLVYSAEHYVFDLILGWLLAAFVMVVVGSLERRWARRGTRTRPAVSTAPERSVDGVGQNA